MAAVDCATMTQVTEIHKNKSPVRRHFLAEWLEWRNLTPADLLDALNDPERSMDLGYIDKSQVYRWLKGQMPQPAMQRRIAEGLDLNDPADLLRAPDPIGDWFVEFVRGRSADEIERIQQTLQAAFPSTDKTGTDGQMGRRVVGSSSILFPRSSQVHQRGLPS